MSRGRLPEWIWLEYAAFFWPFPMSHLCGMDKFDCRFSGPLLSIRSLTFHAVEAVLSYAPSTNKPAVSVELSNCTHRPKGNPIPIGQFHLATSTDSMALPHRAGCALIPSPTYPTVGIGKSDETGKGKRGRWRVGKGMILDGYPCIAD